MKTQGPIIPLQDHIQRQLEKDAEAVNEKQRHINELFSAIYKRQGLQGWAYLANCLFFAISRSHGAATARRIFDESGPPPKRLTAALRNAAILDRLDKMKPRNIRQLARDLALENKSRPRAQQRGAGGISPSNLEDHIRDLVAARKKVQKKRSAT